MLLLYTSVGVTSKQADHLKFLYEYSDEFCVLPSFGVIVAFDAGISIAGGGVPGLQIDPTQVLHSLSKVVARTLDCCDIHSYKPSQKSFNLGDCS